jgi:hypothetical protein
MALQILLEENESHEDEIARHERDDAEEKADYGEHGDSDYESGELESEGDPEVYSGDDDDDEGEWGAGDESVMSPVFSESEEESGDEMDVKSDYTLRNSGVQDYGGKEEEGDEDESEDFTPAAPWTAVELVHVPNSKLHQYFDAHPEQQEAYQAAMENGQNTIINAYRQEVLIWEGSPGVPVQPQPMQVSQSCIIAPINTRINYKLAFDVRR